MLTACRTALKNKHKVLESALKDIKKHIQLQKMKFDGGSYGLQLYPTQVIESYLRLIAHKNWKGIPASEAAVEAFGFAKKWGS